MVGAIVGAATGALMGLTSAMVAAVLYQLKGATLRIDGELWWTLVGVVGYTSLFGVLGVAIGALVGDQVLASPVRWRGSRSWSTSSSTWSPMSAGGWPLPPARRSGHTSGRSVVTGGWRRCSGRLRRSHRCARRARRRGARRMSQQPLDEPVPPGLGFSWARALVLGLIGVFVVVLVLHIAGVVGPTGHGQ